MSEPSPHLTAPTLFGDEHPPTEVDSAGRLVLFGVGVRGRVPAPGGSFRAISIGGRARLVAGSSDAGRKAVDRWRDSVVGLAADVVDQHGAKPFDGPVSVEISFYLPRPKSSPKWRRWPHTRPDLDKLCRSTFDALTDANVWGDDGSVVELHATKHYADTDRTVGAVILIRSVADLERSPRSTTPKG